MQRQKHREGRYPRQQCTLSGSAAYEPLPSKSQTIAANLDVEQING